MRKTVLTLLAGTLGLATTVSASEILSVVPLQLEAAKLVVTEKGSYVISDTDGLVIVGDLIDIRSARNITEAARAAAHEAGQIKTQLLPLIEAMEGGSAPVEPEVDKRPSYSVTPAPLSASAGAASMSMSLPKPSEDEIPAPQTLPMQPSEAPAAVFSSADEAAKATDRPSASARSVPPAKVTVDLAGLDDVKDRSRILVEASQLTPKVKDDADEADAKDTFRQEVQRVHNELLQDDMMVVFPADGETKHTITVFTDFTCPYCRKFHREVPKLQAAGVKVRYLAYPRAGLNSDAARQMAAAFCEKDPMSAFDRGLAIGSYPKQEAVDCKESFQYGHKIGQILQLPGTPTIITDRGDYLPGTRSAEDMLFILRGEDHRE